MPNWNEFAWACFLYGAIGGDKVYKAISTNHIFMDELRMNPHRVSVSDIEEQIISGFLNAWSCRIPNISQAASKVRDRLVRIQPYTKALNQFSLRTPFSTMISIDSNTKMSFEDIIGHCYSELMGCTPHFAATATSKLLHIIAPKVFVMWDKPILAHYGKSNKAIKDSDQGFMLFHQEMRSIVLAVDKSFTSAILKPPPLKGQLFEDYLSDQLSYKPNKCTAKLVDEYNWVVITNKVTVPPLWHP